MKDLLVKLARIIFGARRRVLGAANDLLLDLDLDQLKDAEEQKEKERSVVVWIVK
jgi:hypothetical protein